ncbi:hypothetical protein BZA77DRAFT_375622 [Pyronema omphalodes]|nr:hypothetical protein BZA77DRAFT_375622 [Pyronema omphalodes]
MNSLHNISILRFTCRNILHQRNYSPTSTTTTTTPNITTLFSHLKISGAISTSLSPSKTTLSPPTRLFTSSFSTTSYTRAQPTPHKPHLRLSKPSKPQPRHLTKPPKPSKFPKTPKSHQPPPTTYHMYTDASSRGIGGYFYPVRKYPNLRYLSPSSIFSSSIRSPDQNKREAAAVLAGITRGIETGQFVGNKVVVHCDNVATVVAFSRGLQGETFGGGLKIPRVLRQERDRFDQLVRMGRVVVVMKWIRGAENTLADGLSRGRGLAPVKGW